MYWWSNVLNNYKFTLGEVGCLEHQFTCANKICTAKSRTCNGADDCGDNSDEILPCLGITYKISKYLISKPNKITIQNQVIFDPTCWI